MTGRTRTLPDRRQSRASQSRLPAEIRAELVASTAAVIELAGVEKTYRSGRISFRALNGVDLAITAGEIVAITGPSGSGKTTIINLIGGIDRPTGGAVTVNGSRLDQMTEEQLAVWRGRTIGIVFQFFQLMPTLTAAENAMLPLDLARIGPARERKAVAAAIWPRSASATAVTGCRWSCPAGSSSASPSRERWPAGRRYCSATNRPATLTRGWRGKCSTFSGG
jgi:ABC-type glutathione transport system ATPase component